jgi:hypothetical protein
LILLLLHYFDAAASAAAFFDKRGDTMKHISIRRGLLGLGLCASLIGGWSSAQATPISLDTSWLDANGRLTLTSDARQTLALTGINMSVGGKAATLDDGVFNLPISRITADVRLLPPSLTMQSAQVAGSSLVFLNTLNQAQVSLGNLSMDFGTHTVYGDVLSGSGSGASRLSLFTFDVTAPLSFSLKGGISVNMTLGNLHFTEEGATSFASALGVPSFLVPVLTQVNFGAIDARVVPWFRKDVTSRAALVSSVPEPSAGAMLILGMGLALLASGRARRKALLGARG